MDGHYLIHLASYTFYKAYNVLFTANPGNANGLLSYGSNMVIQYTAGARALWISSPNDLLIE
jgi:hypothetical protein